jgi:hypothetical protein
MEEDTLGWKRIKERLRPVADAPRFAVQPLPPILASASEDHTVPPRQYARFLVRNRCNPVWESGNWSTATEVEMHGSYWAFAEPGLAEESRAVVTRRRNLPPFLQRTGKNGVKLSGMATATRGIEHRLPPNLSSSNQWPESISGVPMCMISSIASRARGKESCNCQVKSGKNPVHGGGKSFFCTC